MSDARLPKPYKGPESYQPEDAALFFGREKEADQLIAKVLSSRITLLHAQSGAGKTSLLNARIIPGLYYRGWIPIRVLPQNDPIDSIRVTTLQTLFPPLSVEREAIEECRRAFSLTGDDVTISQLCSRYDALDVREPLRRQLIHRRHAETPVRAAAFPANGDFDALFCRLLRGNIDIARFAEHFNALQQLGRVDVRETRPIDAGAHVNDVLARITEIEQHLGYQEIVDNFYSPVPTLHTFFEAIDANYGARLGRFGIVLILDQFEELFTRFVDPGTVGRDLPSQPLDWKVRWELFRELEKLYLWRDEGASPLPIRYVISMRDEYIARLDPLRKFVPELDSCAYHLTFLGKESAQAALKEPARLFGYDYSDECFRQIIDELTKEGWFVEPTPLQIVCEKLWAVRGRELSKRSAGSDALPRIELQEFAGLKGALGILRSFFREFLEELEPEMRFEALEMLELLVTANGTRNIVERNDLIQPKFRKGEARADLLSQLERRTIVRVESRLDGQFAEVTHEFLIGPILEALGEELIEHPDYGVFRQALRALSLFEGTEFRGRNARLLTEQQFSALNQFRDRIRWEPWTTELMLRNCISSGIANEDLGYWITQYESGPREEAQASTLTLMSELLQSNDPQVRRNALTALTSTRSAGAYGRIVQAALLDNDPQVREHAEEEMLASGNPPPAGLTNALEDALRSGDLGVPAYALIGRLRSRGLSLELPPMSPSRRMKFGLALRREGRGPTLLKLIGSALLGSIVSLGALFAYVALNERTITILDGRSTMELIGAGLLLPLAVVFATWNWWRPVQRQPDRLTGLLIDLCILFLVGAAIGLVVFFTYIHSNDENTTASSLALAIAASACALGAVRVGTLLAHGFSPQPIWNKVAQILAGSATGTLVLTAIAIATDSKLNPVVVVDPRAAALWIILLPVLASLAWVFAEIDACGYVKTRPLPLFGRIGKSLAALIFASVAAAAVIPLLPTKTIDPKFPGPQAPPANQNVIQLDAGGGELVFPITDLPQVVPALSSATPPRLVLQIEGVDPQLVKFVVPEEQRLGTFQVGLWRSMVTASHYYPFADYPFQDPKGDPKQDLWKRALEYPTGYGALDASDPEGSHQIYEYLKPGKYEVIVDGVLDKRAGAEYDRDGRFSGASNSRSLNEVLPHLLNHFLQRQFKLRGVKCTLDVTWQRTSLKFVQENEEAAPNGQHGAGSRGQDGVEKQDVDPLLAVAPALAVSPYSKFRAIAMLNLVIKRNPNNPEAYRSRAHLWALLTEYQSAIDDIKRVIDLTGDADAHIDRGQYYYRLASAAPLPSQAEIAHDYDLMLDDLNAAVVVAPPNPEAYFWRGSAYLYRVYPTPDRARAINDLTLAVKDFEKAIELRRDREDPNAYKERAKAYNKLGKLKGGERIDFENAKDDANEALKLAKRKDNFDTQAQANALNQLAIAQSSLGDNPSALLDLTQALALFDNYGQAYGTRGSVSYSLGQYDEAEADFDKGISLTPNSSDLAGDYWLRANLEKKWGDVPRADLGEKSEDFPRETKDREQARKLGYVPPPTPAK
jgi:tetratricopeptide (TPR) repeat protein